MSASLQGLVASHRAASHRRPPPLSRGAGLALGAFASLGMWLVIVAALVALLT